MWLRKLAGFMLFKGTAVYTIELNATPFQAGRLIFTFAPCGDQDNTLSYRWRQQYLCCATQCPNVQLSTRQTSATLKIPYITPLPYYDLTGLVPRYDWGIFSLKVFSPLRTGGASVQDAQWSVWLHWEDTEVNTPIVGQTEILKGQKGRIKANPSDQESGGGQGPVSKILSSSAKLASALGAIPFLSSITGPAEWFLNISSGIATAFGWSKPVLDSNLNRVVQNLHWYSNNSNAPDASQPMSLLTDNKVTVMDSMSHSGIDEMSLAFLKAKWAFYTSFNWVSTDLNGLQLYSAELKPSTFIQEDTLVNISLTQTAHQLIMTPVAFLGKIFEYYRGSFRIKIRIVKTDLHSGRLVFSYQPGSAAAATITLAQTQYLHREIIDIRDGDEICLDFPWSLSNNYLRTTQSYGRFYIHVLNELRAPETVSNTIQLLMEVCGCEDLEYQVLKTTDMTPAHLQADDSNEMLICSPIGNSSIKKDEGISSQMCIGESIQSILQILKRSNRVCVSGIPLEFSVGTMRPFSNGFARTALATSTTTYPMFGSDYMNLFASLYCFSRGGVRIRGHSLPSGNNITLVMDVPSIIVQSYANGPLLDSDYILNIPRTNSDWNSITTIPSLTGGFSVQIPQYNRTFMRLNRFTTGITVFEPDVPDVPDVSFTFYNTASTASPILMRSAADDYQLGYFLCIPPIFINFS